jgi:hypothetical protein
MLSGFGAAFKGESVDYKYKARSRRHGTETLTFAKQLL